MTHTFLVATGGANPFRVVATSPRQAIQSLKDKIDQRRHNRFCDEIGISLLEALDAGRLNFIVFDEQRTRVLAGELNGVFQQPASRALVEAMKRFVPPALMGQAA